MAFGCIYSCSAEITFDELSNQNEPMGDHNNLSVFVDKDYKEKVNLGETYECQLFMTNKGNCYFAIPGKKIESKNVKKEMRLEYIDITDTNDLGILDIVMFNEPSKKGNPMGRYHNLSVFPDDPYKKDVLLGEAYYCRLVKAPDLMLYKATPLKKITLDEILELDQEYLDRLVSMVYTQDPTRFDQLITAQQLRENEEKVAEQYRRKISALEKDNEHLQKQLKDGQRVSAPMTQIKESAAVVECIRDGLFYSDKLEDRYYSARINRRGDVVLLVKDENGEYSGSGNSIDVTPFRKMLNSEDIKGMYCEKYGGVVFVKEE